MKVRVASAVALTALIVGLGGARAEDNLQTLEGFRMTAPMDWPTIPQTGPRADAIRQILKERSSCRQDSTSTFTRSFPTRAIWRSARRAS